MVHFYSLLYMFCFKVSVLPNVGIVILCLCNCRLSRCWGNTCSVGQRSEGEKASLLWAWFWLVFVSNLCSVTFLFRMQDFYQLFYHHCITVEHTNDHAQWLFIDFCCLVFVSNSFYSMIFDHYSCYKNIIEFWLNDEILLAYAFSQLIGLATFIYNHMNWCLILIYF